MKWWNMWNDVSGLLNPRDLQLEGCSASLCTTHFSHNHRVVMMKSLQCCRRSTCRQAQVHIPSHSCQNTTVSQCWRIPIIQHSVPIHHVFLLHPHMQLCFIWQSQYNSSHSRIWIFNFPHVKAIKVTFSCRTEAMRGILILVWWILPLLRTNHNVN